MELNGRTSPQMLCRYGSARSARARRNYERGIEDMPLLEPAGGLSLQGMSAPSMIPPRRNICRYARQLLHERAA